MKAVPGIGAKKRKARKAGKATSFANVGLLIT
jgi:hypothetical protein